MSKSDDLQDSEVSESMESKLRRKMARSSRLFTNNSSSLQDLNPPEPKYVKSEYDDRLQNEIMEWTHFIADIEKPNEDETKLEWDKTVLKNDQLIYIQSSIKIEQWLQQSDEFRRKIHLFLKFNEYLQQKTNVTEKWASFESLDSVIFDMYANNCNFESVSTQQKQFTELGENISDPTNNNK